MKRMNKKTRIKEKMNLNKNMHVKNKDGGKKKC